MVISETRVNAAHGELARSKGKVAIRKRAVEDAEKGLQTTTLQSVLATAEEKGWWSTAMASWVAVAFNTGVC